MNRNVINFESLRLYRDILRASRHFTWPNEKGELWRDVLDVSHAKNLRQQA